MLNTLPRQHFDMSIKVNVRTVVGTQNEIEVPSGATIADLKDKIPNIPPESCKFIFRARVLPEDTRIESLGLDNDSFIIVHKVPRRQPRPPAPEPDEQLMLKPIAPPEPPKPATANDPANFEELVQQIMELGIPRERCETALRKNSYDVPRAVDWVLSTPEDAQEEHQQTGGPAGRFKDLQASYEALTPEEKEDVNMLCDNSRGLDPEAVLDLYLQTGKNISAYMELVQ